MFKGGKISESDNYRPFSVLPCISKIHESYMNLELQAFAKEADLIQQHQFALVKYSQGRKRLQTNPRFLTFLPYPLPALLLAPFFARGLTLVPGSLLRNRTETLATQVRSPNSHRLCSNLCNPRFRQAFVGKMLTPKPLKFIVVKMSDLDRILLDIIQLCLP